MPADISIAEVSREDERGGWKDRRHSAVTVVTASAG